jgi:ABC-type nitrate/sulfonate/bicarbonate transport system ATPase subunit
MDEPFSALDTLTRTRIQTLAANCWLSVRWC